MGALQKTKAHRCTMRKVLSFFSAQSAPKSASVAKDRLKIVFEMNRLNISRQKMAAIKEDILKVFSTHGVKIDFENVEVSVRNDPERETKVMLVSAPLQPSV